ncbi:hypothetical protein MRX96_048006 [Rhipicephalus microplus]
MSQGASGNTERDTHDAVGVDPEASTRSRPLQPAVHDDRTGKSEDTSKREVRDAVRPPFFAAVAFQVVRRGQATRRKVCPANSSRGTVSVGTATGAGTRTA